VNTDTLRCHLCQVELDDHYTVTDNGLVWCVDLIACKFRARRRLGIPAHVNYERKARDLEHAAMLERQVAERLATAPRTQWSAEYAARIASTDWQRLMDEQKLHARHRCERCGRVSGELHGHHPDYATLGRERPEDVLVVCPLCHDDLDELRHAGRHPKATVQIVRDNGRPRRAVVWHDHNAGERRQEGARP